MPAELYRINRIFLGLVIQFFTAKICEIREVDMAWVEHSLFFGLG